MNKAEQLIACLEGEIAKRDAELAACRVAVENCEVFLARIVELEAEVRRWVIRIQQRGLEMDDLSEELKVAHTNISGLDDLVLSLQCKVIERDAELAALKAQEPVSYTYASKQETQCAGCGIRKHTPLRVDEMGGYVCLTCIDKKLEDFYAAPVSEAKAQVYEPLVCDYCNAETQDPWHGSGMLNGVESRHIHACSQCRNLLPTTKAQGVVMPAELDRAFITGESCDGVYRVAIQSETLKEMQAVHSWLTSLNAAPVQQVSVPASAFASRAITHYEAALLAAFPSGSSGEVFNQWNEARRVLAAAPAAPAADASDVLEQAMYTLISIGYHENSGLVHELRQALAAHRAKGGV